MYEVECVSYNVTTGRSSFKLTTTETEVMQFLAEAK